MQEEEIGEEEVGLVDERVVADRDSKQDGKRTEISLNSVIGITSPKTMKLVGGSVGTEGCGDG